MEIYSYGMRFTFSKNWNVGNVCDLMDKYLNSNFYVIGCEVGKKTEKPHCHVYCQSSKKVTAIRKYLRSKGLSGGNKDYSIVNVDMDSYKTYMAYCIKEDRMPFYGMAVTDDIVNEIQAIKNSYVKSEQVKKSEKRKVYVQVKDYVFEDNRFNKKLNDNLSSSINCTLRDIQIRTLSELVIEFFLKYDGLYREFQVVAICQTLMLKELNMKSVLEDRLIDKLTC